MTAGCDCTPELDEEDPEDDGTQYKRACPVTGDFWWSLHCPHDGYQNRCPLCGDRHYSNDQKVSC